MDWLSSWAVDAWIGCRSYCPANSSRLLLLLLLGSVSAAAWRRPMDMGEGSLRCVCGTTVCTDGQELCINKSCLPGLTAPFTITSSIFCSTASFATYHTISRPSDPAVHTAVLFHKGFSIHICMNVLKCKQKIGLSSSGLLPQISDATIQSATPHG